MSYQAAFEGENTGLEVEVKTPPASESVTEAEAKNFIKENYGTDATEDALITSLIKQSTNNLQDALNLSFITQVRVMFLQTFERRVLLPYGPHSVIVKVERIYQGTATALVNGTDYWISRAKETDPAFKTLVFNQIFHLGAGLYDYSLRVEYNCGYGSAAAVPDEIKQAILKDVANNYFNRGDDDVDVLVRKVSNSALAIARPLSRNI